MDSLHTNNFVAVKDYTQNGEFTFLSHRLERWIGLTTYALHLGLVRKLVVDFLLVIIELFLLALNA